MLRSRFVDRLHRVNRSTLVRWSVCVAGTAIMGEILSAVQCPAAWLIAGLIVSGATALASGRELAPHRQLLRPAQGVIGVLAAAPLALISGAELVRNLGLSVGTSLATLVLCLVSAYMLYRGAKRMDPATAVLSTLAGGASGISTMAPELGVDHRYVAMSQYFRLVIVTLTLPALLVVAGSGESGASVQTPDPTAVSVLVLIAVVFGSGYIGRVLRIPSPFLLTPLLVTIVLGVFTDATPVPGGLVSALAYVVIGWQAGGSFSRASVKAFTRLLPLTLAIITVTIVGCLGMAWVVASETMLSFSDAYLATTPGGIYAALAVAQSTGAGSIVTTAQVIRLVVMLVTAILVARYFARKRIRDDDRASAAPIPAESVRG